MSSDTPARTNVDTMVSSFGSASATPHPKEETMKTIQEIDNAIKQFKKDLMCHTCGNKSQYLKGNIESLEWVKK